MPLRRLLSLLAACALPVSCASTAPIDPAGLTWEEQESGTAASLRGLCVVSERVCWASGAGGTYLRTTDAGKTWTAGVVPGAQERDFRDVEAFDADTALLLSAGEPAEVWRTADGGASWKRTYHDVRPGVFFDAMDFWDERRGMAFSDPIGGAFLVIETRNGGESWSRVPVRALPAPRAGEAGFAASGTCLAVAPPDHVWIGTGGGAARVLWSSDAGQSWKVAATPMRQGEASSGTFSIVFVDAQRGAAVGGDYQDSDARVRTAAVTTDGGRTWRLAQNQPTYRSCVAVVERGDPPALVAIGKGGASLSLDAGLSWAPLDLPGHFAIDFAPGSGTGWAVGAEGRVTRVRF